MSHASGVVIHGPANTRGEIDRGPTDALYAIHFAVPVLCTARALRSQQSGEMPDRLILGTDEEMIAHDVAVMVLTHASGANPVPLYPFEPRDKHDTGVVFREALYEAVEEAVASAPPVCLHLVRFDHTLLSDGAAERLQQMGFAVETFDSNQRPAIG